MTFVVKKKLGFPGESSFMVRPYRKRGNGGYMNFSEPAILPVDDGGGTKDTPTDGGGDTGTKDELPYTPPVFPDFSTMTCEQLSAAIANYKSTLAAPSFVAPDPRWTLAMNNAIASAQSYFDSKACNNPSAGDITVVVTNNPPVLPAVTTVVPGASGGMPGGGGMSDTGPMPGTSTATTGSKKWLWWLVGGGIVIYYLLSGSKKS